MEKTIDPAHEIGENVTITDRSQLLSITPEQAKKIKSLRIENQDIDDEFSGFLGSLGALDSLYFYKCKVDGRTLMNVCDCSALGVIDCALTYMGAVWLLPRIKDWFWLETLDLSHNMIGNDADMFFKWWRYEIFGRACVKELILADNHFPSDSALLSDFKDACSTYGGTRVVF